MEYLKWMLAAILILGFIDTGFGKSTGTNEDYEVPQDDEDDYDDNSKNVEIPSSVHSNDVLTDSPPYFPVTSITVNATKGEDVILPCDVKNLPSNSKYVIMWLNGSQLIATGTHNTGNIMTSKEKVSVHKWPTIKIHDVEYSDRNQYLCSIVHYANLTVILNVIKSKAVVIYARDRDVTGRSMTFQRGDPVEFECRAIGIENAEIKWSLNGEFAKNHVTRIDGGKVTIASIDVHQAGTYQCLGDDHSNEKLPIGSVTINVQYAPKVWTKKHYVNTMEGDKAEISCEYMAEPIATAYWERHVSNKPEIIPRKSDKYEITNIKEKKRMHSVHDKTISTLTISNVNEKDLGEYTCHVNNSINATHVKIHLTYGPETPLYDGHEKDGKNVFIHWIVISKQEIREAGVDYKLNGTHNKWMTENVSKSYPGNHTGSWKLTHELQLAPGKWHVRMRVRNKYGWSKFSKEHDIPITEDIVETPPEDIVYAGDIVGAKIGSNNNNNSANQIIVTTVPFYLMSCLLLLPIFNV